LFPFIDLDNGGSVDGYIAAQRELLETVNDTTRIIPGHGPLGNKADLEKDLRVLIECRARVLELIEQGKNEDEIVTANPLAEFHDTYNWGFITTERMTRTLVRFLSSEN
jgi:glyoxylase-like metal-dependent hydrolase (beta-lactamase superfamily II)